MWDKIAHNSESSVAELSGEGRYELDGAATASSQLRKYDCVPSEPRVTIWPCVSANINSFLVFCRAVIYHKATHRRPPPPRSDGSRDPSFGVGHWIATVDQCPWQQEHQLRHQHLIKFPCLDAQQIFYHFLLSMVKVFQYISKVNNMCVTKRFNM